MNDIKPISNEFHQYIKTIASEYLKDIGEEEINKFKQKVLAPNNINYADYVSPGKGQLRRFLELMPDIFALRSENNDTVWYCRLTFSRYADFVQILSGLVEKEGRFHLAKIAKELKDCGIDYKEYSGKKGLKGWIESEFSAYFKISDDGYYLLPRNDSKDKSAKSHEENQLNSLVFMSWWVNNARILNKYSKASKTGEDWAKTVSNAFCKAIIGINPLFCSNAEGETLLAFDTGARTPSANSVYCVLKNNPSAASGKNQPYTIEDFCCPAEDDNELSAKIRQAFPEIIKTSSAFDAKYNELENLLQNLSSQRTGLAESAGSLVSAIEAGAMTDASVIGLMEQYHANWQKVCEITDYLGWSIDNASVSISALSERLNSKNRKSSLLKNIVDIFTSCAQGLCDYCRENMLNTTCDIIVSDMKSAAGSDVSSYDNLTDIIRYYTCIANVSRSRELNDEVIGDFEIIKQHFPALTEKVLVYFFMGKADELDSIAQLSAVYETKEMFDSLQTVDTADGEMLEFASVDTDSLLKKITQEEQNEEIDNALSSVVYFPASRLEKMIAFGEYDDAQSILEEENESVCPDRTNSEIADALRVLKEQHASGDMTLYECGMRVLKAIGNHNRTAEKYFIAGLVCDAKRCASALFDIYMNEENKESYLMLWKKFGTDCSLDFLSCSFLLDVLAYDGMSTINQYLADHVYLFYMPEYAQLIGDVARRYGYDELEKKSSSCHAYITSLPEYNDFELGVINSNTDEIEEYLNEKQYMLALFGYSQEEQHAISLAAQTDAADSTREKSSGAALYKMQKNKNAAAERLLWQSLARGYTQDDALILMNILNDANRSDECTALYECYQSSLQALGEARELYMLNLIATSAAGARDFIVANMQDFMTVLSRDNDDSEKLLAQTNQLCAHEDDEISTFFETVIYLKRHLTNPLLRAVITLSAELRDIVTDNEKLLELGLPQNRIESCASIFKTDSYSRGRDIRSISERLYTFVGTGYDASRDFAFLALSQNSSASTLVWRLMCDCNDEDEKLSLLRNYPELRRSHIKEYLSLLINNQLYEEFLDTALQLPEPDSEICIQTIIAKCNIEDGADISLGGIESVKNVSASLIAHMIGALYDAKLNSSAREFIFKHFDDILTSCNHEEIRMIVTANGALGDDEIGDIQIAAFDAGCEKFAIYIYENFGIGSYQAQSADYYDKLLAMYERGEEQEQQSIIKQLKNIYSSKNNCMCEITLMEIRHLVDRHDFGEDTINAIAAELEYAAFGKDEIAELMIILEPAEKYLNDKIYRSLIRLCSDANLQRECVAYFNKISSTLFDMPQNDIFPLLCSLYTDAARNGWFSDEWTDYAVQVCTMLLETQRFCDAAFCMYNIQKILGNIHAAKFILFMLIERKHSAAPEMLAEIENEANQVFSSETQSIFDLFTQAVAQSATDEIVDYCRFCGKFIKLEGDALRDADSLTENKDREIYSKENSEMLLKLLYKYPVNPLYWDRSVYLPLEDTPVAYTKVLYQACLFNPRKETLWDKCINACERYSQDELLSAVLLDCAKNIPSPYSLQKFRTSLAEKSDANPLYFSRLQETGHLTELVSVLCERLEQDSVNKGNHSAIRDLAAITVATDSRDAFEIMMKSTGKYIFEEYCNLGFVVACRLILRKRFDEARTVLTRLTTLGTIKYRVLISKLSGMDTSELAKWGAEDINRQLIKMMLPDGNYPDIMQINNFALSCINGDRAQEGAQLLCELIDNIPTDYGCHMALFMVCKQLPDRTDYLHRALCGLISNEPAGNSKTYYSRTRKDYALLLANINAVIKARHQTSAVSDFDGYDFRKSAREYYCEYENEDVDIQALAEIEDAQTNIENALMNRQSTDFDIMCSVVVSWVTGNWADVLIRCYRENIDLGHYIGCYPYLNNGFARSVLKAVYSLPEDERGSFMHRLSEHCAPSEKEQLLRARYLYDNKFYTQIPPNVLEGNLLDMPFEEYSLFNFTFRDTIVELSSKAPALVYPCAMIVSNLAFFSNSMIEFWQTAMTAFESGNDLVANGLFAALNYMWKKHHISHKMEFDTRKSPEKYESLYRVTGVFSGNEQVISKVSGPDFHAWSCINMVMGLLYTNRANEVNRLKQSFADNNKKIVDVILVGLNPNKSDTDKINAVKSLYDDVSRALICFIFKIHDKKTKKPVFVKEETTIQILSDIYSEIAAKYPSDFGNSPRKFLWIESAKIHENAYSQISADTEFEEYDTAVTISGTQIEDTPIADSYTPSFVASFTPDESDFADIEQLWAEHEGINSFGMENYRLRLDISKRIYQIAMAQNASKDEMTDYMMRYGVDYYYYCMGQKDFDSANSVIKEMAACYDSSKESAGQRLFKNTVCNTALHELLHRGYTNIRSMTDDYAKHKTSFIHMRNMLPASSMSVELDDVNRVYAAIETLVKCYGELSSSHTSAIRKALINAKKQLGEIGQSGWINVKLSVLKMIQDEINKVDQRPILSFEVLSLKANKAYGSIYGQVRNMGKTTAENIVLQLDCSNGFVSDSYELAQLANGETAAFEVNYSASDDCTVLDYDIVAAYSSNGENYTDIAGGKLEIIKEDYPDFSTGLYLTDRPIMDFAISDDGSVVSENFFGRNEEKQKIQAVFSGGSFINYKNVIVNGIRRAGKTSILNYLIKYAEANCTDAVTCMVTCEGISTGSPIQYVLIDAVIKHLRLMDVSEDSAQKWDSFAQKWKLPEDASDRNADDLQYFYRELKQLNGGKGLVLVIDEIDILFEYVEKNQGLDSTLFPALRTLLCNMYCQEAVHLVICGSNKLIRYMDGGTLNQLFQQFGDNIIEVGRLLPNDMNEMLTKPYQLQYPHVQFTKEALSWIWKYTSGLVWYAKLLSNCALSRAKSKGRCSVYPSDVADGLYDVIGNDNFFKSLITSCRTNELKILDAMQSHTSRASEYISLGKIMEILTDEFTQKDIETIINTLERMNLVCRNPYDRYSYRFAVELYWHYFRVYPSNYERVPDISNVFKKCKVHSAEVPDDNY